MSSRALRRAQRELEEKQIQQELDQEDQEDESEEEVATQANAKPSMFALLGEGGDDEAADADDDIEEKQEPEAKAVTESGPLSRSKKSKKKKKKGKAKQVAADVKLSSNPSKAASDLDEIDQALLALNPASSRLDELTESESAANEEKKQLFSVLSVDPQHLHAANEMKKLFGRAALQDTDDEPRHRQRGHAQQAGLAAAVAGRNAPGRGLASLGLRRNIFIQGKEEWPRATSGGLAMEIVEKRADGSVEYRFVHNRTYQEVQQEFLLCVASMDSERMIQLLHLSRK